MSFKPKTTKDRILHRLKITRGHLNKVIQMTENNNYCMDILHQSQAIQNALKETDHILLENHLKTCASDAILKGNKDEAINEIMQIFKKTR